MGHVLQYFKALFLARGLRPVVLAACLVAGCGASTESRVELRLGDGNTTSPTNWEGSWVLINYWADWCTPCRDEVPELNELQHHQGGNRVLVFGVNFDQLEGPDLAASEAELGIEFPTLLDDPFLLLGYETPQVLPMTVILSPTGEVRQMLVGPQTKQNFINAFN